MKKNIILSYLAALAILYSLGGIDNIASAEVVPSTLENIENIQDEKTENYEALPIKSIYNMTKKESEKVVTPLYLGLYGGVFSDGSTIILPCRRNQLMVIKDEEINVGNNKELIALNQGILVSTLKELIKDEAFFDLVKEDFQVALYGEVSSNQTLFIENNSTLEVYYIDDFFKEYLESNKPLKIVDRVSYDSFGTFIERHLFKQSIEEIQGFSREKLETRMTIEEFRKTIYEKIVNEINWPVKRVVEKKPNLSLPKFKQEFLDSKLDKEAIFGCGFPEVQKISILENRDGKYYDIVTGQLIVNKDRLVGDYDGQIKIKKSVFNQIKLAEKFWIPERYEVNSNKEKLFLEYFHFVVDSVGLTTVGALIEAYQYLPLELQVDYSYFDFRKSPNVVQEPEFTPGSMNFEIDYDNGVLNPVDKTKIKS